MSLLKRASALGCFTVYLSLSALGLDTAQAAAPEISTIAATELRGGGLSEFRLKASDAATDDFFGDTVSIFGNRMLVGAPNDDDAGIDSGSVYVFEFDGASWQEVDKLVAPDGLAGDRFGEAVSLHGDRALIGASRGDGVVTNSGTAYVFNLVGGVWQFDAKLMAADGALDDRFGIAVSVEGDRALVGSDFDDDLGGQSGSAYLYERIGGNWVQRPKWLASDGAAIAEFGLSVSLSGDRALVGAPGDDENGIVAGAAYIFEPVAGVWQEVAKLLASDGVFGDGMGISASLSGSTALVGSPGNGSGGAAYVFDFDGINWSQTIKLTPGDAIGGDLFGETLALAGSSALVGAPVGGGLLNGTGAAYRFQLEPGGWQFVEKLFASDGEPQDRFGASVDVFAGRFAVGAD